MLRSCGLPRVDDRRVVSGIVYVLRNGLRWSDSPPGYGPHKTLYNRYVRWSRLGVFERIFVALVAEAGTREGLMIDAMHLKGNRLMQATARRLLPVGGIDQFAPQHASVATTQGVIPDASLTTPSRCMRRRSTTRPVSFNPATLQLFLPRSIPNVAICIGPLPSPPVAPPP